MITAAWTPAWPHSSSTPATVLAGDAITARSTGVPDAAMVA